MNFLNNEFDDSLIEEFAQALNVSRLISFLLINRGTRNVEEAKNFLHPHFNNLFDPFLLKDMDLATSRIEAAINKGENILVYGDEDVDGISSTAILLETLRNLGGKVDYIIPNKAQDGIGLREKFIHQAQNDQVALIITVDCGITNFSQVELAKSLGIDVIITDHHEPQTQLPAAYAVVNPMRKDCTHPFKRLSGAGVALKVSQAVSMKMMQITKSQWFSVQKDTICFAMLGTIGDRVPLTSENRIFARFGLERIRKSARPWVRVLIENFYSSFKPLNMSTILSLFIPLLSSGESKNGKNISCDLLLSDDVEKVTEWADELHAASQDWFFRARNAFDRIKTNLTAPENNNLLVIVERDTEVDVLSYCASKIKDLLKCPVVMIGFKEEYVIGEARAPKGCDLIKYFRECEDLFIDYGGHKCAAGFSVLPENLPAAISRLNAVSTETPQNTGTNFRNRAEIEINETELVHDLFETVPKLAPFGEGNPVPFFKMTNIQIRKVYDGYRVGNCSETFWATRRVRHQLNISIGQEVTGNIEFFIDGVGRGYISRFQTFDELDYAEFAEILESTNNELGK